MKDNNLDHIIATLRAQVEQDEAMARVLYSHAARATELLDVIAQLQEENEMLREQQHVTHITNYIDNFNGDYIETVNYTSSCQPLSTTFTEPTSSESTITSKINITNPPKSKK